MHPLRFALFADEADARAAFDEMADAVREHAAVALEPIFVPSYAALAQAIEAGACDVAWSPPIVAQGLLASGVGKPLVAVGRGGRTSYYAVILARPGRGAFLGAAIRADGALARLMNVDRFEVPSLAHFETLRRWTVRAVESESSLPAATPR